MRVLRALLICMMVAAIPAIARADLWVNVHEPTGSTHRKILYVEPWNNCARLNYGGVMLKCTDKGSITLSWALGPQAARDATCVLSVWSSGTRPLPLTWHMDLSKNDRGMCIAKWANDNTIDLDVAAQPDYFVNVAAPPNGDFGLTVNTTAGCRNNDNGDRRVECSRAGSVIALWNTSSGKQEMCTVRVQWFPWPVHGLAPISLSTGLCYVKKLDKTHADFVVKFNPNRSAKP